MMKKHLTAILAAIILVLSAIAFVGCGEQPASDALQTVTISNKAELTADWFIGDADRTVAVEFTPDSFTVDNTEVTVTSDNRDVVAVDGMKLKAVGIGKAVVTVEAEGKTDTVQLNVSRALGGVAITNKAELTTTWYIGDDPREVTIKLTPDEYTLANTDVTVTSENTDVIMVGANNILTAVAAGKSKITVTAGGFTDEVEITVDVPELVGISLNEAALKMPWTVGDDDREVVVTYDPAGIYNKENTPYTVTSDNTEAVTVIDNKKLHAVAFGASKITVTAGSKTAEVTVNVRPALESVTIANEAALKAKWVIGDAARTVEVAFAPSDHYSSENTTVEITSSNEQAIVVSDKTLTAVGLGKSTITVTAGDKTAEIELEVVKPDLTKIAIGNKEELNVKWAVGDAVRTVEINYTPHNYYNDDNTAVTVSSSNTSAITVSGKALTPAGVGTSTITVTYGTGENALTDSVEIAVVRPDITSVTITNKDDFTADWQMNSGTKSLAVSLAPAEYYSLADVEVVSSDSNIVSVNKTDDAVTLTAIGGGEATITVKVGNRQDSVTVKVVRPALNSLSITSEKTLNWTLDGTNSATITVSFDPAEYYSAVDVTVTASGDDIVTTDGLTVTANGNVGTATITVAYKNDATVKDTITVTTTVSDPSIELSGNGVTRIESGDKQGQYQLNGLHGAAISLPTVNKAACDNRDDNITLDALVLSDTGKMTLDNNKLTVSEKGEFTVTYTVKDSRDQTKTATAILNISIFRKVLADNGDYSMKEGCAFVEDDKQVVVGSNTGISFVPFNVQPSKNYYAEVTFDSKYFLSADGGWWDSGIGMGHFLPNVSGRLLMSYVDKAKTHKVKDFNTTEGWETNEENDASIIYSYKLDEFRGITFNTADDSTPNTVKYAIARIGDDFFCFVNDVYVCSVSPELYRNSDTIPGIFAMAMNNANGNTEATKISYVFDAEAKTKVSTLLKGGSGVASAYRPFDGYPDTTDKITLSQENTGYTFNTMDAKEFNDGCVSPYVYFDGDFTFEYEYKPNQFDWSVWEAGSILVIRSNKYGNEMVRFGIDFVYSDGKEGSRFIADVPKDGGFNYHQDTRRFKGDAVEQNGQTYTPANDIFNYGAKFRVTRKIVNGKATFAYSVSVYKDEQKTVGYTWGWTFTDISEDYGAAWDDCTKTVQMIWHNKGASGTYSNIRWAHTATPDWDAPVVD